MTHRHLGVELRFHDAIDCDRNILLRHLSVANLTHADRTMKLFLHHDFHLSGTDVGDTAYFDPTSGGLFHYQGKVRVLSNVQRGQRLGFDAIATGTKAWGGREGTWRDAEDGALSGNPIAQGSVESVGELSFVGLLAPPKTPMPGWQWGKAMKTSGPYRTSS
jgi:GH15 family glucan-1,4-alpha-glucosidase